MADEEQIEIIEEEVRELREVKEYLLGKQMERENHTIIQLKVSVNRNGDVNVAVDWADQTDSTAGILGHMLFKVNEGDFKPSFYRILTSSQDESMSRHEFVQKVVAHWENNIRQAKDLPAIRPLEALKFPGQEG